MPERQHRDHANSTADAAPAAAEEAHAPGHPAAIAAAGKGPSASDQAYGAQGETEQMRMQMAMDKRQKSEQMASNMEKKESGTAEDITKNMK